MPTVMTSGPADTTRRPRGQTPYTIEVKKPFYDHKPKHKRKGSSEHCGDPRGRPFRQRVARHPVPPAAGRTLREPRTRRAGQERGPISEPTTPQASDPRTAHPRAHAGCSEGSAGA